MIRFSSVIVLLLFRLFVSYSLPYAHLTGPPMPYAAGFSAFAVISSEDMLISAGGTWTAQSCLYNLSANQWLQLPDVPGHGGCGIGLATALAYGDCFYLAGGQDCGVSSIVSVLNTTNKTWQNLPTGLSSGRFDLASAVSGSLMFFAGGTTTLNPLTPSGIIDILDASSNTWLPHWNLSTPRISHCAAACNGVVMFAGGHQGNASIPLGTVDAFEISTGNSSVVPLVEARYSCSATTNGIDLIIFAGGSNASGPSAAVDIFNVSSQPYTRRSLNLSVPRISPGVAQYKQYILFAGGDDSSGNNNAVEILDTSTMTWLPPSTLFQNRSRMAYGTVGTLMLFAGGFDHGAILSTVDYLSFSIPSTSSSSSSVGSSSRTLSTSTSSPAQAATTTTPAAITAFSSTSSPSTAVIAGAVAGAVGGTSVIVIIVFAVICIRRRRQKRAEPQTDLPLEAGISTPPPRPPASTFLRPGHVETIAGEVQMGRALGGGYSGKVYEGRWEGQHVALKELGEGTDLQAEARILQTLRHPNCVQFFGIYVHQDRMYLVMELCSMGSLDRYLRTSKPPPPELIRFAHQIANGMQYLHSMQILHRDLAARNVLIDQKGDQLLMKITDFGLSKRSTSNTVSSGPPSVHSSSGTELYYQAASQEMLPVRWTAPEAFSGYHSTHSDVWSFGILLWEMFSHGAMPYPELSLNADVFNRITSGYRMQPPALAPAPISTLMLECWDSVPSQRPTFSAITKRLYVIARTTPGPMIPVDKTTSGPTVYSGNMTASDQGN